MALKNIFVLLFSLLILSCSVKEKFPEPISQKILDESLTINSPLFMKSPVEVDSSMSIVSDELLDQLVQMKAFYEQKSVDFDLQAMEDFWEFINSKDGYLTSIGVKRWIVATGFLFEITGEEKYIKALEKNQFDPDYVIEKGESDEMKTLLEPYIFTRDNDFFHVNLFTNASVEFEHSLFGEIKITQETTFPQSGDVKLKFNAEKKRFMEIYIRIPDWAEGATVTMQNVKYIAPPGDYCKIAKNWHDGDSVEIHFPVEKMPAYYAKK